LNIVIVGNGRVFTNARFNADLEVAHMNKMWLKYI